MELFGKSFIKYLNTEYLIKATTTLGCGGSKNAIKQVFNTPEINDFYYQPTKYEKCVVFFMKIHISPT